MVSVGDQAEQDFIFGRFGGTSHWIGLSDADVEGDWTTWVDGSDVTFSNWGANEPNSGDSFDYAYQNSSDGRWYDGRDIWTFASVIEFTGDADTDGDGIPDVIDWLPDDPANGYDIREAGPDGVFDTADDDIYTIRGSYDGDVRVSFNVVDGPLAPGDYRFTITPSITDPVGNALDGNSDGTGGDAFTRLFSVAETDPGFIFEGRNNNTFATATPLNMLADAALPQFLTAELQGSGSIDNSSDVDYWKFDALAGDQLLAYTSTLTSGMNTRITLYNSAGQYLTESSFNGANDDDYLSGYTLPSDGEYFLLVNRRSGGTRGDYELHVHTVRNADAETDADYNNDAFTNADPLNFTDSSAGRTATTVGLVMPIEANGNFDEDTFALGPLNAGNVVELDLGLPTTSTLIPLIQLFDSAGNLLPDEDGNLLDDKLTVSITSDDEYFARVTNAAWTYGGHRYEVLAPGSWTDLQAEAQARGGYLISVNDAQERNFAEQAFGSLGQFWLGLSDVASEGTWVWTDGTADTYTAWDAGEPNTASNDYAYRWTNGLWYDTSPNSNRFGIAEIPDAGGLRDGLGPGGFATYVLDVTLRDTIGPRVTNVTRLPDDGVVTEWLSTFEVDFSETLDSSKASTLVYDFATFGGNTYVYSSTSQTWPVAQDFATSLGGNLVSIGD
ncbi:MAG: lectin-like protein, partial [Planctomycetota bacterium]